LTILIDHLKEQIKKSGYPLEIEISSILDKKWEVMNTDSYFDSDEEKMRDIDINSIREIVENSPLMTLANLTIECKKNEKFAWVFFTRPYKHNCVYIYGQYLDGLQALTQNFGNTQFMDLILCESKLHYSRIKKVAPCYDEVSIQARKRGYNSKKSEIFEAVNQLKKYIIYSKEQKFKSGSELPFFIDIHFPCIVFDGEMFEARIAGENVELSKIKHVALISSHRTPFSTWDLGFLVDIVHKNHFKIFLNSIENGIKKLKNKITKHQEEIFEEIMKTQDVLQSRRKT